MSITVEQESRDESLKSAQPGDALAPSLPAARYTEPWLVLAVLVILGGISGMAYYLGFVNPYRLSVHYNTPLQDLAKLNGAAGSAANAWALTWIVLFACYFLAFRFCPPANEVSRTFRRAALFIVCGWAAFYSINMLFMYPVGAADIFDQIFRARLLSHYGLNPFVTLPASIQGDPLQKFVAWRGDPSPYGPMWESLAGGTSWLAGDDLWRNLVLFKLLVMVAYGINIVLTYGILRASKPDWALRGTLFFAWNPLMVFEVAGNGHNDSIVATFILLAVYLFVTARRVAVFPAVMAGALTKFVPVLLGPIFAAAIWRDRVGYPPRERTTDHPAGNPVKEWVHTHLDALVTLAIGTTAALGMAVLLYAPFWTGPGSIGALSREKLFTASLPKVALDLLTLNFGVNAGVAQDAVRSAAMILTILVTLGLTLWVLLKGEACSEIEREALVSRTLSASYEVIFFYLAFATLWFQPWYLIWLIALTAPVGRMVNANRTILFCLGGVANYFVWDFIWLWNKTPIRNIQVTAVIAIYSLPLFYSLYVWVKPWVDKRTGPGREISTIQPVVTSGE